jgi:hypothetical protein
MEQGIGGKQYKTLFSYITCIIILILCETHLTSAAVLRLTATSTIATQSNLYILDDDFNNSLCNKYHISLLNNNIKSISDCPDGLNDELRRESKLSLVKIIISDYADDENKIISEEHYLFTLNTGGQLIEGSVVKLE